LGIQKISQLLRRVWFLPVSRETVRRRLHEQQLLKKRKPQPQRHPPQPRFFERSTPNQMWQTDIFTFRLGGKNAYRIGFLDDYSRYVVGLDVFRSQTAEQVLEVYHTAMAEYGVPKEGLSDQGRQYSSWRGTTRFQAELRKDRVPHLKSRPHHPMTLGKIERFWKTIWEEFLVRAQFESFESARERVRLWVKHYNHQRPHQALEGLCPADRFFAIAQELRQVIERGIQENVLELALRGQPCSPFYMVGRRGEQSVVIRAEKGKVKMLVEGEEPQANREVTYNLEGGTHDHRSQSEEGTAPLQCAATSPSGPVDLDRAPSPRGSLSGTSDPSGRALPLGEAGSGGDAAQHRHQKSRRLDLSICPCQPWDAMERREARKHHHRQSAERQPDILPWPFPRQLHGESEQPVDRAGDQSEKSTQDDLHDPPSIGTPGKPRTSRQCSRAAHPR
jgi:transposase InsO family protein